MSDHPNPVQQSVPTHRSPWTEFVIERALAEKATSMTPERRQHFVNELAQRLAALREWDRYEEPRLPRVALKRDYRCVGELKGHTGAVGSLSSLPCGDIVSGSDDRTVRVWRSAREHWELSDVITGHTDSVTVVLGMPDGHIVSGSKDRTARIWRRGLGAWEEEFRIDLPSGIECLQSLPGGKILSGHSDGALFRSSRSEDGVWKQHEIGNTSAVWGLHALPDGTIVTAHQDGKLRFWTEGQGRFWNVRETAISEKPLYFVQVVPDKRILVGASDGCIRELAPLGREGFSISIVGGNDKDIVMALQPLVE